MGGCVLKYFPEEYNAYEFDELEMNRIIACAFSLRDVKNMIKTVIKDRPTEELEAKIADDAVETVEAIETDYSDDTVEAVEAGYSYDKNEAVETEESILEEGMENEGENS